MPASDRRHPHALVVSALALVLFLAALDQTVVGTVLPRIAADLGGFELYAWVFTAYMLATSAAVPIAGKLGDVYGRRRLLVIGIVEFVISSGLTGLAPTMELLIAGRVLQGVGAGILAANAQAALGDLFPPAQLSRYNGMMSGVYALSSVAGPLLGGAITDSIGWRWVFLVNLPIGLLALVVVLTQFRPQPRSPARASLDLAGAIVLVLAVTAALAAVSGLDDLDSGELAPVVGSAIAAVVLGVTFVRIEARAAAPIIPLRLLGERELRVLLIVTMLSGLALYATAFFPPLMLQGALGASPTAAGTALMPLVICLVVGGIIGGGVSSRRGSYKEVIVVGLAIASVSAMLLARHAAAPTMLGTGGWLGALGFGIGLTLPTLTSGAQNAVGHAELGIATSLARFARIFGGILGVGMLGALVQIRLTASLRTGLSTLLGGSASSGTLARELAEDPGAMLTGDASALADASPLLAGPELAEQVLALLRDSLARATAEVLWATAACLVICTLWTARLDGRRLRTSFEEGVE